MNASSPAIVCLAHLGWDYVWQRPQHILSRLARRYPVLYINEPRLDAAAIDAPLVEQIADCHGVHAVQPHFPDRPDIVEQWRALYTALVQQQLVECGWAVWNAGTLCATRPLIIWFYTPTPMYLLDQLPASVVVYDVMDELANFKGASADLRQREEKLLEHADIVFTGGRSLYESRRERHANVALFASGVEPDHFRQALDPDTPIAPELTPLPRPIVGYYGVIDERIDLDLIDALAQQRPAWSIAMVGPVTKIAPDDLPRRPNIHYLGQQPYARLPQLLKGFDVCLMPFARNEATRFISPTKTLEYMAAHKPIVSTPIADVVASYADAVQIAEDAPGFAAAIEQMLDESAQQRQARVQREASIVARNTWDAIAQGMIERINEVLARQPAI